MRQTLRAAALIVCLGVACGCSTSTGAAPELPGSTGGGAGAAGDGGAADGASGTGGLDGGLGLDGALDDHAPLTPDSACAGESHGADPIPLDLYLMLDRSGSMGTATTGNWAAVKSGLQSFFADPSSAGLRVALAYFPAMNDTCDPADYSTPVVGLGPLTAAPSSGDPHEAALVASLEAQAPTGQTPMYGALAGALGYCIHEAVTHPKEKVAAVLVTDGSPNSCPDTPVDQNAISVIAALAGSAYSGTPPVVTFAVGLSGSNEAELSAIAAAGGGEAFFLGSSPSVPQDLLLALKQIAGSQIACEFGLPVPDAGSIDPSEVNVVFIGASGTPTQLYKVDDAASCVPNGWYYDDPVSPTRVLLCPAACSSAQADPSGHIDVLFGCESLPPP